MTSNEFSKFFEEPNTNIVIETQEQLEDIQIDDDIVYEIDVYNNFMASLPIYEQNNKKIQEKYLKLSRHLIHLKNEAKKTDIDDLDDYADMSKIYDKDFQVDWIFPVVLDKKKIYKKVDIDDELQDETLMDEYVQSTSDKGIQYEDFIEELNKSIQYNDEFKRDKLSFKTYRKLTYDLQEPYIIKTDIKKKEVGFHVYMNQYAQLLRYFNIDNKFWQTYNVEGPDKMTYEQFDKDGKFIGTKTAQLNNGAYVNIIGFLILANNQDTILDALNGSPFIDRIRMIGTATKIKKNSSAIVEMKAHGLKNGDKVMIDNSNSEPSIDGEYVVKIINDNEFMVPVNLSDGKEGTTANIYAMTHLNMDRIDLKLDDDYSGKLNKRATLYIFPEKNIEEEDWKKMCKKVIPSLSTIIDSEESLKTAKTIDEFNSILKKFNINLNNLNYDNYFKITEIFDEQYLIAREEKKRSDLFLKKISENRNKLVQMSVKEDILFGDKYLYHKEVLSYYGSYPQTEMDSVASRYNWLLKSPDYGKLYFLIVENEKISEYKETTTGDIEKRKKDLKAQIDDIEKQLKKIDDKVCEKRKITPVVVYPSFDKLFQDNGKITQFKKGDYALIESKKSHENGMIYEWNGMNWTQNAFIESVDDLCLFDVQKIGNFDIEKLKCLFKTACKSKNKIRLERKADLIKEEIDYIDMITKPNIERKIKDEIQSAKLRLQIYMRKIVDTKQKETIEVFIEDVDELYLDILKVDDMDTRDYYRNLLIKKDGILIGKDIYSIRTKKKICCGHYYYFLKMNEGTTSNYNRMMNDMIAIYGTNDENGMIYCSHDGRPLTMVDYDTAEGLSKSTGEVDKQRETVMSDEDKLKDEIMESIIQTDVEHDTFDCSGTDLRKELTTMGFKIEDIAKAKDICLKLNTINSKTGIVLRKSVFVSMIADILQFLQKIPDQNKFKQMELIKMKEMGVDMKTVDTKLIMERYSNLMIIKKCSYIGARLLITYESLIPFQSPIGKRTGVIFEGFSPEYLALLIEESRIMPIVKTGKNGTPITIYLPLGKIKDEIIKAMKDMEYLPSIKKLRKEKKDYERKKVISTEEKDDIRKKTARVSEAPALPDKYAKEVEKAKKYSDFHKFQMDLKERQAFIAQEIIDAINEAVSMTPNKQIENPKTMEYSGLQEELSPDRTYYSYISEKTKKNVEKLLEESRDNMYYTHLFLNTGCLMKHFPQKNRKFEVKTRNLGIDSQEFRKKIFLAYIQTGVFKGELHQYEKDVCVLTGETKDAILKKEYTDADVNELLQFIIKKKMTKLYTGGSKEDLDKMAQADIDLIDATDLAQLKKESDKNLQRTINLFMEKFVRFLNKSGNKSFVSVLRERIEGLGTYKKRNEELRIRMDDNPNTLPRDIIEFENNTHRERIHHLKIIINQYFRRYMSIVSNQYDVVENIKEIPDMDTEFSIEIQKYIYDREYFLKKYLIKRDRDLFQQLEFDISSKIISNITANPDEWDKTYTKIDKIVEFNLKNLVNSLMYVLMRNLERFISSNYDSGDIEKNKVISQFIMDILDLIRADYEKMDVVDGVLIEGDYRTKEAIELDEDDKKGDLIMVSREEDSKKDKEKDLIAIRDKFVSEYKKDNEKDPTENEIMDYLDNYEKEEDNDSQDEEDDEENIITDDTIDVGGNYGEKPQGGEGGEYDDF